MKYFNRSLEKKIKEGLDLMPAVFLNGPRQAGKSTLVRHMASTILNADYATFDDISVLALAANNPEGFLHGFLKPLILDEVQIVPAIFRAIKLLIDERRIENAASANGRYLLTGSANILALPGLADALVGRMAVLTLYPLSAVERYGQGEPVINGWFDQDLAFQDAAFKTGKTFAEIIYQSTFPEAAESAASNRSVWYDSYLNTLLQRDVRQLAEIEKIPALPNIVKILAARAGSLLNDADCARDAKLNAVTYRRYRALLQQLFLIALVPPWYRNIGKRLVKSPKLFFVDTALLCHQLGVEPDSLQRQNPGLFGHVLENFVASELTKQLAMQPGAGALYHFRTHDHSEVDFVIERRNGKLLGIEVKASTSIGPDDFSGLKTLKDQVGTDFARGIVLYLGKSIMPFGDNMWAMPLENLWNFNMAITADKEMDFQFARGVMLWAGYGERTRIRCHIPQTIIDDHFHDKASEKEALAAVKRNWKVIWPVFVRKITDGQIETMMVRNQKILEVRLESTDLNGRDYRSE